MAPGTVIRTLCGTGLLFLAGSCGGGNTDPEGPPASGELAGILYDTPVQGVAYSTSSGVTGVTDAAGGYAYNADDVVTFRLGGAVLGTSSGTGVLTPIELAAGGALRLQNLLVLFQSLDNDGNPANGIVIPPAAAAALTSDLNLNLSAGTFASAANAPLVAARAAGGITTPIVTTNQANAEFKSQLLALLGFNIWILSADTRAIVVRATPGGSYVQGEVGPADGEGQSGLEMGVLLAAGFDPAGYWFDPAGMTFDSNGRWGLSHTDQSCERFIMSGEQLVSKNCQGEINATFKKMPNQTSGLVGAWALGSATALNTVTVFFFPNGKVFVLDPVGDTSGGGCGGPGVEYGNYTFTGNVLRVSGISHDTNGCAGLSGSPAVESAGLPVTIGSGGGSATAGTGPDAVTLHRVSK